MEEIVKALILASCQSQVDLMRSHISGLIVNKKAAELIASVGGTPPVDPATYDRLISSAQSDLDAALSIQSAMGA
jgi:hypothetical protein